MAEAGVAARDLGRIIVPLSTGESPRKAGSRTSVPELRRESVLDVCASDVGGSNI